MDERTLRGFKVSAFADGARGLAAVGGDRTDTDADAPSAAAAGRSEVDGPGDPASAARAPSEGLPFDLGTRNVDDSFDASLMPSAPPPPRRRRQEKAFLLRLLHPEGVDWGANVRDFDPAAVESTRRMLGTVFGERRYFPLQVHGWEHLPPPPVMIVSNHSGGTLILDTWGLAYAWYTHHGTSRPIHPAAHEMILGNRFTGPFFAKRGIVRADKRVGHRVLTRWRNDLLVMPGGDLDVWRPYNKRYEVDFAGRTGYARLALEAGVPIVPVANAGAHETLIVLTDGRDIAKKLRFPELARAHIFPISLALPWGLLIGPWPHLPPPTKLRYRFGPAIRPADVDAEHGPITDDQVAALDAKVRASIQRQLDQLRDER